MDHNFGTGDALETDTEAGDDLTTDLADQGAMTIHDVDDGRPAWIPDHAADDSGSSLSDPSNAEGFGASVEATGAGIPVDAVVADLDGYGVDDAGTSETIVLPANAIHGAPDAELRWAQVQSENGFCVPVAAAMIVSEVTGIPHAESAMVQAAVDLDLLYGEPGAWLGMTTEGTVALLDHFGVDSRVDYGTLDELRSYLDDRLDIILMVDSGELWGGALDDVEPGDAGADHAVVITGIDDARAMVTLNDPGQTGGQGWEVSIADFMDAWDDSNYEMVMAGGATHGATDDASYADDTLHGSLSAVRHPSGQVLLPVVLGNQTLRPGRKTPPGDKAR